MDRKMWRGMVSAIKGGHVEMLRHGFVPQPVLHAFVDGNPIGYIRLRPVRVGADAGVGIAEMGIFYPRIVVITASEMG